MHNQRAFSFVHMPPTPFAQRHALTSRISSSLAAAREQLICRLTRARGIPRMVNGLRLHVDPGTRARFGRDHDSNCAAALRRRVRPGDVVWNAGANVGVYTLQLAHMVGASGRVVAFEPNSHSATILQRNIRLNGFEGRVRVEHLAVAGRSGRATLFASGDSQMARLSQPNPMDGPQTPSAVGCTTLNDYARANGGPAGIVMDIEGAEIEALQAATDLLREGPGWMLVELHPDAWDWSGHSAAQLAGLLDEFGWSVTPLSGQQDPLAGYGHVLLERR